MPDITVELHAPESIVRECTVCDDPPVVIIGLGGFFVPLCATHRRELQDGLDTIDFA